MTDNIRRLKREKKERDVYERFLRNNPNEAYRVTAPQNTTRPEMSEWDKARSRAVDMLLQDTTPRTTNSYLNSFSKDNTAPTNINEWLTDPETPKRILSAYEREQEDLHNRDYAEKPVSMLSDQEKTALKKEYESISNTNVVQRWWNQNVRSTADALFGGVKKEDYPDYGADYERKQALSKNYREIKNSEAYKAMLDHGFTDEYMKLLNTNPLSTDEIKVYQDRGMSDDDINEIAEKRSNLQQGLRRKFEDLMATVDESWGVTVDDITNMMYEKYALPEIEKDTLEHPVVNSLYTLASNPVESAVESIANIGNYATGKPMRNYDTTTEAVRNTVTENIDNQFGKVAYGGAMSIGDTAVAMGIGAATGGYGAAPSIVSAGIQALEKASQVMGEGADRNLTPDQIFAEGIASGLTTYLTEKIPMGMAEKVVENGLTNYSAREIGKYLGSMFVSEGLQEGFEDVADWAADAVIAWDKNEFNTEVQELIAQGMSKKDAVTQVVASRGIEMMTDIVIGGISGVHMGSVSTATAYYLGKFNSNPSVYTDKILSSPKALKEMIDAVNEIDTSNLEGEDLERVEKAKETANQIVEKVNNSEGKDIKKVISTEELADLANVLNEQANAENRLSDTINEINYQASVDQNLNEYAENKEITPKEYETEIEKAARNKAESIAVQMEKSEREALRSREKALRDYEIKGIKSKLGEALNNIAQDFENEAAQKNFLENYKGQNASWYAEASLQAFHAGESGQSFNTFLENSREANLLLSDNQVTEAYLKTLFYNGQNARTEESTEIKLAKNPNRGLATGGVDELTDLKQKIAEKLGVEVATNFEDAVQRGDFAVALARITVNATADNQYSALMHEVFEFARAYNPKGMAVAEKTIVDMLVNKRGEKAFVSAVNSYKEAYRKAGREAEEGSSLKAEANKTFSEAQEEFVNDAISYVFSTEEGMNTFVDYLMNDKSTTQTEKVSALQAIKDWIDNLIKSIKNFISKAENKNKQLGYEYAELANFNTEELEKLSRLLTGVLDEARANLEGMSASGEAKGETAHSLEVEAGVYGGDQDMRFSIATYADAENTINGRDYLKEYLKKYSGLSKKDQKDIIDTLEWGYEVAKEMADGEYKSFSNWSNTRLETDDAGTPLLETFNSEGRPIRSVVVNNGEYPLNIDFSQVCKKRIALNNVLNQLVTDADLNLAVLTESDIAGINNLIKEHQFEIACGLCFVDARRYRVGTWADSFVNGKVDEKTHKKESMGWNDLVMSMLKKGVSADYFNLASDHTTPLGTLLKNATDDQIDFKTIDKIIKPYINKNGTLGKATEEARMAYLLKTDPTSRMFLDKNDIIASEGLDALRAKYPNLYTLVNSHGGTNKPKLSHGFTAYGNEILRAESWKSKKNQFNKEDAYAVGGVRVQSFSDYVANLFFDYMQMFADMSARELPSHAYTKEATYARLFGMTGQRINMSLIFKGANLTKEQSKRLAKLLAKGRKYVLADEEFGELCDRAGLDENGDYIFEDESFDFEEAKAIQNDPRYKYCGTIGVGLSNRHIRKMLSDPDIKMVIPYHSSGVSQIIKNARNLALYTDYTDVQNTRDRNGKKLDNGEPFDWYAHLKSEANPKGLEAKKVADEYLKFCDNNGYTPKFDAFRDHPNYYKLLIDFRAYDNDGKFMPQTAVKMNFPEEAEFKKLVSDSLKAQQETEDRMEKEMSGEQKSLYKEVKDFLKEQGTLTETSDVRHSLEVKYNLETEENEYIKKELLYKNKANNKTTFKTKDGKIGIRNNRSLYIVEEMDDTEDPYRPIRIYDVDVSEQDGGATNTTLILKEIERNEKEGRRITGSLSLAYLKTRGLNRPGEYIRFYDFDNMRGSTEYHVGKAGNFLSTPIKSTRNVKNRARNFGQRPSYKRYSLAVHAGDLGKSEGFWQMTSSRRGTGHFGTGTYFVGDEEQINKYGYENRPHEKVDFDNYNLFKPKDYKEGMALHEALKFINNSVYDYEVLKDLDNIEKDLAWLDVYGMNLYHETDVDKAVDGLNKLYDKYGKYLSSYEKNRLGNREDYKDETDFLMNFSDYGEEIREGLENLQERFDKSVSDLANALGISEDKARQQMLDVLEECSKIEDAYHEARYADSPSTRFMKAFGYEGVDVRDIKQMDNVEYGSVIYDLKGDDLKRKQEIGTARYSLPVTMDSEGRKLSKEQQEYFKDSKVLDEDGNLLRLYHGSMANFTIFDIKEARDSEDIEAFFFSADKEEAGGYGNTREFYLNITNPADYDTAYNIFFEERKKKPEGAGARTRDRLVDLGYDGVIAYDESNPDYTEYLAFYPEQIKMTSNKKPTKNEDIRFSLSVTMDSEGKELSEGQKEFFKDSKAVDENGNLLVLYHGSKSAEKFTVFENRPAVNGRELGDGFYFTTDKKRAEAWGNENVYKVYLNITNPFYISENIKVDQDMIDFAKEYESNTFERMLSNAESEEERDAIKKREDVVRNNSTRMAAEVENYSTAKFYSFYGDKYVREAGYDGLILKADENKDFYKIYGDQYVVFDSNQIKKTTNKKPTGSEDIRHSISVPTTDSEGRTLSEEQQEYFSNSVIRDENGNLKVMYHGTTKGGFVVFDPSFSDDKLSLFFADNKDVAKSYSEDEYTHKFDPYKETKPINNSEEAKEFLESEGFTDISYTEETVYGKKVKMWSMTSPEFGRTRGMSDKKFVEYAEAVRTSKNRYYETYLNIENPLTVNAEGGYWNRLQGFRLGYEDGSIKVIDISFIKEDGKYRVISDYIDNQGVWSFEDIVDTFGEDFAKIVKNAPEEVTFDNLFVNFASKVCLPNGTRTAAIMAKYSGKDGVVIENVRDFAGGFHKKKHAPCMIAIAFDSNQVKSIYNENPTEDPDIRHSVDVPADAFFEAFQDVEEQVKIDESDLEKFIKNGDLDSDVTKKAVKEVASNIKKQYNSNIKLDRLTADIMSVFKYLKSTGNMSMKDIMFVMKEIARPVLEDVKTSDPEQEKMYKDFINKLKGYKIALDAGQTAEVAHSFGSYYEFQRAMSGKMNLSKNGTPLDNIWTELCDISDGHLSYGTNPNDQPMALAEYIYGLQPSYQTMEGETLDDAATDLALEIFRQFYVYQSMTDAASKVKGELNKRANEYKNRYKKAYSDALKQVEMERNLNIERLAKELDNLTAEEQEALRTGDALNKAMIENLKADYQRRLDRLRAQSNEKIAREKAKFQNAWITKNLKRERSELKNRVLREVKALQNLIAHPSEGATKHVPINLIKPTIEMLEAINLDNGGRNKAIAERLKKMAEVYESFKGEEYSFDYDERIANDIKELREMFENKSYADLEIMELEKVIEIVTALKTQIKNANNLILQGKLKDAQEAASSAMSSVRQSRRYDNAAMNVLNKYANVHLNAYREFRKLSGYMGGAMMDIYEDLDAGSKKEMQIQKDLGAIFQSVLEGKENQKEVKKFISTKKDDLVDIGLTDKNGKPILITRAMRMSLIMHSMNASNMRHVLGSGITIPNMYYFEKGKMDEAYAKGTNYRFVDYAQLLEAIQKNDTAKIEELTKAAEQRIEDMKKDLSEWEKRFLAAAEEMFHEKTGKYINETSLALKGYAIARVKNYFPIKTDAHFTTQEWAGLVQNGSLEGSGVLKERVVSTKPILLEDITNVIERQIRFTSKYAGLAIAVRNFETIMKQTSRSQTDGQLHNLYETIDSVWGASDTKWLKNLMQDIQGGRGEKNDPLSSFLSRLRGQFAGATLAMNVSVAASQAASYPTAGAVLGFKPLMKAMKDMSNGFVKKQGIEELEDINPLLWYRNQGNATQDLADAKKAKLPPGVQKLTNWIEFMDTGTVRTLEYASMYYVDENFSNLEKGSEEYWQKVSEIFSKVVEETQPNYSVLHRPDILRSPNAIIKLFSMFKTQSLQNFGIVYDALGELNAAYRSGNKQWQKQAATKVGNAVGSQVAAATMFSAIKVLAQLLYHRIWKFRDEDDEWSWAKFAEMFGWQLMSTFAGCFMFGSEIADWLKAYLTKTKSYGVELSTVSMINDFQANVRKALDNADKLGDSITEEEKEINFKGLMKNIYDVGVTVGEFVGVPVNNVKNLVSSIFYYGTDIKDAIETGEFNPSNESDIVKALTDKDVPNMYERIYEVYDGDSKKYDKLVDELKEKVAKNNPDMTEVEVAAKVQEDVTDHIIKLLKADYFEGNKSMDEVEDYLMDSKGMTEDDAYIQIKKWEGHSNSEYKVMNDTISVAAEDPTPENRKAVIEEVKGLVDHGKTKKGVYDSITRAYKDKYIELYKQGKATNLGYILQAAFVTAGFTDTEAKENLNKWLK